MTTGFEMMITWMTLGGGGGSMGWMWLNSPTFVQREKWQSMSTYCDTVKIMIQSSLPEVRAQTG